MAKEEVKEGLPKHEGEKNEDSIKHMSSKDGKKKPGRHHGRKSSRK